MGLEKTMVMSFVATILKAIFSTDDLQLRCTEEFRGSLQIAPYSKVIFIRKNLPSPTFKFHGGNMLQ